MQVLLNGMIQGLPIALLALAFNVVYQPARIFYLALAGVYACAPFVTKTCLGIGLPDFACFVISAVFCTLLSLGCEFFNHRPLEKKQASMEVHLIASLGVYFLIVHSIALFYGNTPSTLWDRPDHLFSLWSLGITKGQLISVIVSGVILGLFFFWLYRFRLGLIYRAVSGNPIEMSLKGFNLDSLRFTAFGISGLLASTSSNLNAVDTNNFDPYGGLEALVLAVISVIIGGRNSFAGPVLGALIIGVLRNEVIYHFSARWTDTITFLLLVLFLLFRPGGLIQTQTRIEAF